jgi:hypothetical protein
VASHTQTPEAQSTVVRAYTARALAKDAGDRNTAHLGYSRKKGYLSHPARKQIFTQPFHCILYLLRNEIVSNIQKTSSNIKCHKLGMDGRSIPGAAVATSGHG